MRYADGEDINKRFIVTFIPKGTAIPVTSREFDALTPCEVKKLDFNIFEANSSTPDENEPDRDYTRVCHLAYNFGTSVPKGYPIKARIIINEKHLMQLEAYDPASPDEIQKTDERCIDHLIQ